MAEALVNGVQSTLNGSINNSQPTITIQTADQAHFPGAGTYRVVVSDNTNFEIMTVTGGWGTATLTVSRASETYNGAATAFAFGSGSSVTQVLTVAGLQAYMAALGAYAPSEQYAVVSDQKAQNTAGGTFTSGAWRTRDLNAVLANTGNWLSLASNQISLLPGTYRCRIECPAYGVDGHVARLQNITAATTLLTGSDGFQSAAGGYSESRSFIEGRFTLTATATLEIQHRCITTQATSGFGKAVNLTTETYTQAEFWLEQQAVAPNGTKLLLDYTPSTDITGVGGTAFSATTWTDLTANQTFTIDDANALIQVGGQTSFTMSEGLSGGNLRVNIDNGAKTFIVGGNQDSRDRPSFSPVVLSAAVLGLGAHTVKLQFYSVSGTGTFYCANITDPNNYCARIQVLQIPQSTTTLSPAVANGAKLLLNYTASTDISGTTTASAWQNFDTAKTFAVDDPNGIVEISLSGVIYVDSTGLIEASSSVLVDGTTRYKLGMEIDGSARNNALSGSSPVKITGLGVGSHTVQIQTYVNGSTTSVHCNASSVPNGEFLHLQITQIPQVQATPVGGTAGDRLLLNYAASTDLHNGTSISTGSWTTIGSSQSFTVDDPSATIEIAAGGQVLVGAGSAICGVRLLVDGATARMIGGAQVPSGTNANILAGCSPASFTGLATGSHTVEVQVQPHANGSSLYLLVATSPNQYSFSIRVWQRPTIYRGASVPSAQYSRSTTQSFTSATAAAVTLDTKVFDTDSLWDVANGTRLTIRTAGKYLLQGYGNLPGTGSLLSLRKNGVATDLGQVAGPQASPSYVFDAAVADYFELWGVQSSGSNQNLAIGAQLSAIRIGDAQFAQTNASNVLGSDVAMASANTYYDGPSVALAAGTWLVTASVNTENNTSSVVQARLWDGTTVYAESSQQWTGGYGQNIVSAIILLSASATIKVSIASNAVSTFKMHTTVPFNGTANKASRIDAIKIG